MSKNSKFIVSMLNARRDYDVAKILYQHEMLEKLFTDTYYNPQQLKIFNFLDKILPQKIVSTYKRYQPNIPHELINYDWYVGLKYKLKFRLNREGSYLKPQIEAFQALSKDVITYVKKAKNVSSYYGFDAACLEFFEWASLRDWFLVTEQAGAPRKITIKMHEHFSESLGLDEKEKIEHCKGMQEREEKEWSLASVIIAPSPFVKNELIAAGAPAEKIRLVPFGYDSPYNGDVIKDKVQSKIEKNNKSIRVLFAGNSGFRKGIHDLLQIAKELKNENIQFVIAGSIEERCLKLIQTYSLNNVQFLGKLNVKDLHKEYANADIFFFPSYIEGSAMVIFEAMSWGLPIVASYQTGSVITNEYDGFICNAGDTYRMKNYLLKLVHDKELRFTISQNAFCTMNNYSLKMYSSRLINAVNQKNL